MPLSYDDFEHKVWSYPQDQVLTLCGRFSSKYDHSLDPLTYEESVQNSLEGKPWSVARIATASLVTPGFRRTKAIRNDAEFFQLINREMDSAGGIAPRVEEISEGKKKVGLMLAPLLYEQDSYRANSMHLLASSLALFERLTFDWSEVFGVPLPEAFSMATFLRVVAANNNGLIDLNPETCSFKNDERIRAALGLLAKSISKTKVGMREYTLSMRALQKAWATQNPGWAQLHHSFVPLTSYPLIDLGESRYFAPQTMLVTAPFYTPNLGHRGFEQWENIPRREFSGPFGKVLQEHVGECLSNTVGVENVLPEIAYGRKKAESTIDWFFFTKRYLVLVEVKSAKMNLPDQTGGPVFNGIKAVNYAATQIDETMKILQSHSVAECEEILAQAQDREIVSLIVTSERLPFLNQLADLPQQVPCLVISADVVEHFEALGAEKVDEILFENFAPHAKKDSSWNVFGAIGLYEVPTNHRLFKQFSDRIGELSEKYLDVDPSFGEDDVQHLL